MSTNPPRTRNAVTAIIVAHDGAQLLPGLARALEAQTCPVEQTVAVDTGSRDGSGAVLTGLLGPDAVLALPRNTGYGEAVAAGLRQAVHRPSAMTDPGLARVEWIWLLHDDCEPAPDALDRLLRAAGKDRSVVVLGPKVLDGQDRRTLREVGVSIDRAGRRVTGIDPGEIDQGQHDHKRDVLAVSSAGMLVRRDVWDRLRGFDPWLPLFRDDVDFCWRVQAAGLRVQVATDAVLYHRELSGRRRRAVEGGSARGLDRRSALYVLAVNLPLLTMLWVVGGSVAGSLGRALYFLLTKQLDMASAYAFSVASLFGHPVRLVRGRRRRAARRGDGYNAVQVFIPPARTLFRVAERIAALVSNGPPRASGGRHQASAEESEEDEQFVDAQSAARRFIGHPGVQLFTVLLLVALIAERRLLGTSPLGGGALVPAWGGAAALWHEYLAGFHAAGLGSTASASPYLAVLAALATVLGGQAWLAVDVLLLGCVPLAGLTAYLAARPLVSATPARVLLAASYALLPVATGAVAAGRLGTAAAFILLPLIAVSAGRMLTAAPRQARRAAWAAGLLIALAAAFAPFTWALGVLLAVGALAARRWLVAVNPVNAAVVAGAPFFVLFPWSLHLLTSPSAFLSEAGLSPLGLTTRGLSPATLLALSPGGPGLPPVWVTIGFGLALAALAVPARRPGLVIAGWTAAVTGLLTATLVSRASVTPPYGGPQAAGWPGVALALAALGLLLAAAPAAQRLAELVMDGSQHFLPPASPAPLSPAPLSAAPRTAVPLGAGRPGPSAGRRLLAGAVLAGAATAPLFVAGYWINDGVRGPVGSVAAPVLPAFVAASAASGEQYRTLILRAGGAAGGTLDYAVVRQGDPTLGEPELGVSAAAGTALTREVAALGAPDGADAGDPGLVLGDFGIRYVLLPGPVDAALAQRLDAAVGLEALSKAPNYDLWQVTGAVARVRVVAADGSTTALSGSSSGVNISGMTVLVSAGTLVLAEPHGGWTARLNGRALKPLAAPVDGWAQGFVLPPGGGTLTVTRDNLARATSLILELIAALAVGLLALPGKRANPVGQAEALAALREARSGQRAASSARRAATPAGAGGPGRRTAVADRFGFARNRRLAPGRRSATVSSTGPAQSVRADHLTMTVPAGREKAGDFRREDARTGVADAGFSSPETFSPDLLPPDRLVPAALDPAVPDPAVPDPAVPDPAVPDPAVPGPDVTGVRGAAGDTVSADAAHPGLAGADIIDGDIAVSGVTDQPGRESAPATLGAWDMAGDWGTTDWGGTGWESNPGTWAGDPGPGPGPRDVPIRLTGPTGPQPTFEPTGPLPTFASTGSHPVLEPTGPQSASEPTGPHPTFEPTGPQRTFKPASPRPTFAPTAPQPVERAPWEAGDWNDPAADESAAGRLGAVPDVPEPGSGSGAWPAAARPEKPERHSHRAAKHGRPSRWRGPGNRSGGNGGS